jgi:hypothetical protein
MHLVRLWLFAVVALGAGGIVACSSTGGGVAPSADGGGLDGGVEEGGTVMTTCTGVVTQTPPMTNACTGDPSQCLSGTATTSLTAVPTHRCASVYRTFPEGTARPLQTQLVAVDGTWAFSGLPSWGHYYVFFVDDFQVGPDAGSGVPAIVGPFAVPVATSDAGVAVQAAVKPVQLEVLESKTVGGSWQVQWASAHVFDPSLGSEIANRAVVSAVIGGAPTAMPWVVPQVGSPSYFVEFSPPPAAQPSYTILTADPSFGAKPVAWNLVAAPPSFDGTITAPADGATVSANTPLVVSWGAQPAADFILTELFQRVDGGWIQPYTSPQPNDSSVTSETIPKGTLIPGQYLLNVAFASASCPATADGCVLASSIAVAQFTAQ